MSIENCKQCGEATRDTDYDLESGYMVGDDWYCQECAESPVELKRINVYPRSLEDTINRLEADLERMMGTHGCV